MNANTNSASPSALPGSGDDQLTDPVDWEARYRAGDTPWDEGYAAPALTELLARHPIHGEVLVPGSGPGHDVRALASQSGIRAKVTGIDLSPAAVELARSYPNAGGEHYECSDLFDLPASCTARFDWVVEHTCFCAIPPSARSRYVTAIADVLKPGGHYFAIFYMNPATPEGPPHGVASEEISNLFDPNFDLLQEWRPVEAFEGRMGRELCQLRRKR
jgi:SAM-dependent methyltransferase